MATILFTAPLRTEYQSLFDSCQIHPAKARAVDKAVDALIASKRRYKTVGGPLGIPWQMVAVVHNMEASQNFRCHLHNGDPLSARTRQIPKGRPRTGSPPFTWEYSASDALSSDGLADWKDWSIPGLLYCLERYNGWGYRKHHPSVKSPYLWSGSNHYRAGKYVADGTWSDSAVSKQLGAATLLRRLAEKGELDAQPHVSNDSLANEMARKAALFTYAPKKVTPGGVELQRFLNTFPGIFLREDGVLGPKTSAACEEIFGRYLKGDPRG